MKDLYLGDIIEGECYDTFTEQTIYIKKRGDKYCETFERFTSTNNNWCWNLRTVSWLKRNIRTIIS